MKIYDLKKAGREYDEYYANFDPCTEFLYEKLEKIYDDNFGKVSQFEIKSKLVDFMCRYAPLKVFEHSPFFFEFSSGRTRYTWGGLQSKTGQIMEKKTTPFWLALYEKEIIDDNKDARISCWNNAIAYDHYCLGYDNILEKGFEGILKEAKESLKTVETEKEKLFLDSAIDCINSLLFLATRFSDEASELAKKAKDDAEKEHFEEVARLAKTVPFKPASTFKEALCSIMFCREAIGSVEGIGVSILGHLDRMLEKYYLNDLKNGIITYEEMKNLLSVILLYTAERFEIKRVYYETSTAILIGGCFPDGRVCFNDITRAILESVYEEGYLNTKINCRISSKHPDEYFKLLAKVQAANIPALVLQNDDVLIPSRVKCGQDIEDARTYVSGGCHELVLQNSEVCFRSDTYISAPMLFLDTMKKSHAETFDEFYAEMINEFRTFLESLMQRKSKYEKQWSDFTPMPLYSSTMDMCIEKKKDVSEGGTKYNSISLELVSVATLVDSIYSVKTIVYDEKKLTIEEFYKVLETDYEGNEALRKYILEQIPKYGTGNDEVDEFAAKVLKDIANIYRNKKGELIYKNGRGGYFFPAFYSHESFRRFGRATMATPDGRKAGMYLSRGCSPSEFIKTESPVSVIKSLKKIDFTDYAESFCAEMTLPKMEAEKGEATIFALIKVFLENQGSSMQINLLSREELIEAQKNPEEHQQTSVRVCGYSAKFVTLDKEKQDEIISRQTRQ